jgi:hypothetical protein
MAMRLNLTMLRPSMATFRPYFSAAQITDWMRWMWLAKVVTKTLPGARPITRSSSLAISISLGV